jgi:alkylation response protein AidB-like acyl-CoA dehydrogenase
MNHWLTPFQKELRQGMRAFCDKRVPVEALRTLEKNEALDRALWSELSEMGVFGLRLPEKRGGAGLGFAEAVLVFCELGRRAVPGPLVWTHLAAGWVDGADSGKSIVGGLDRIRSDSGPILIEHLSSLDALLVLTRDGVFRLDPKQVKASPIATPLDPLTPVHHAAQLPAGERIAGPEEADRLRLHGAALVAGLLLGIAETTLEMAVAYAKDRQQFGRPIGSFQAIKHMLADMFVRQEVARASAYAAAATLDHPEVGDERRAVSQAKLNSAECAVQNALYCIQVHGGMGFTWEVPCHYYLKRTSVLDNVFGSAEEHADTMADLLG